VSDEGDEPSTHS